jgi:hypothetical protein
MLRFAGGDAEDAITRACSAFECALNGAHFHFMKARNHAYAT